MVDMLVLKSMETETRAAPGSLVSSLGKPAGVSHAQLPKKCALPLHSALGVPLARNLNAYHLNVLKIETLNPKLGWVVFVCVHSSPTHSAMCGRIIPGQQHQQLLQHCLCLGVAHAAGHGAGPAGVNGGGGGGSGGGVPANKGTNMVSA